jgi:hypothetical protein
MKTPHSRAGHGVCGEVCGIIKARRIVMPVYKNYGWSRRKKPHYGSKKGYHKGYFGRPLKK